MLCNANVKGSCFPVLVPAALLFNSFASFIHDQCPNWNPDTQEKNLRNLFVQPVEKQPWINLLLPFKTETDQKHNIIRGLVYYFVIHSSFGAARWIQEVKMTAYVKCQHFVSGSKNTFKDTLLSHEDLGSWGSSCFSSAALIMINFHTLWGDFILWSNSQADFSRLSTVCPSRRPCAVPDASFSVRRSASSSPALPLHSMQRKATTKSS